MDPQIQDKLNRYFDQHRVQRYIKGEIIIQAGEAPTGVQQLLKGTIEQYDITPEGNRVTVNIFKPPAFFPMAWAINKTPNSYFYHALTDVELRVADADATVTFLKANPDVMFDLLSRLYRGTDALLKRHVVVARRIALNQVIFELLIESYRFGTKVDAHRTLIKIKRATLAARCGLARETVSRGLHRLQSDGLLEMHAASIVINVGMLEKKLDASQSIS